MPTKKTVKPEAKKSPKLPFEIDTNQLLLHSRQLFLSEQITSKTIMPVVRDLMALQLISEEPIVLWINSPGGSYSDGVALIDQIQNSKAPIYTVVSGMAASMAGIISVTGHVRLMTEGSVWMGHDGRSACVDYFEKILSRVDWIKMMQNQIANIYRNSTKLTEEELTKARTGELWLNADQCLLRGVVDQVIRVGKPSTLKTGNKK